MLNIKTIREREQDVRNALGLRGIGGDIDTILECDQLRRKLISEVETLKQQRNAESKEIGKLRKQGLDASEKQAEVRQIGERIKELDDQVRDVEAKQKAALLLMPNLPHSSVPVGKDETENQYPRSWGTIPVYNFEPKKHWELAAEMGLIDFERGAKITGTGFPVYCGSGARLQRALIQFMLDVHVTEHGYKEIQPPYVCNADSMTGTGQLPKMAEDMYHCEVDDLYLIPTAEVPVTNLYREEIIQDALPILLTAYTPCFRREAGAAGRENRGLNRLHQFDKVEMVKFVEPATSYDELELLLANAEDILQRLKLPYRICELCTGDLSFAAAKCYDIELWAPGQEIWLEVSSCSNFEDFQARRANIRYRDSDGKPQFVHTLNGSGVALPRLMVAIMENYQQEDGSILIPEVIRPYMGGMERITIA
ncbi:MAG: serine--tRNA ligase [Spartobacteria bacterium]|nr:serine--tRNA ligase [Spartobacteria bacterium]